MRFPHRVRITDPRNRQPPEGVAYVAWKYDYINLPSQADFLDLNLEDGTFVEPPNSEPVSIEVDALVNMVDDGDNNQDFVAYSVKVPSAEVTRAGAYFREQRQRSQAEFGYVESYQLSPNNFYRGFTLNRGGTNVSAWRGNQRTAIQFSVDPNTELGPLIVIGDAMGSSEIPTRNLDVSLLSFAGTGSGDSPLDGRARAGTAEFRLSTQNNSSSLTGLWPPIANWSPTRLNDFYRKLEQQITGDDVTYRTYWVGFGDQADGRYWGYPFTLSAYRMDTFPDLVDFRARVDFTWL